MKRTKSIVSLALSMICLSVTVLYTTSGGLAEVILCSAVALLGLYTAVEMYRNRGLAQTGSERREQLSPTSMISIWSLGGWVALIGGLISLIAFPQDLLRFIATWSDQAWGDLRALVALDPPNDQVPLSPSLSMSPIHTWRWCALHATWLLVAYLSSLTRGSRSPLIWCLALCGPTLTLVGLFHWCADLTIPYGVFQLHDRAALSGFLTPLVNNNHVASLMMLSVCVSMGLANVERGHRRGLLHILIMVSLGGMVLTSSRTAIGIMVMLLCVWRLRRHLSPFRLTLGVGGFAVMWLLLIPICVIYWSAAHYTAGESLDAELIKGLTWRDSIYVWWRQPMWGVGRGAFGEALTAHQSFFTSQWISHPEHIIISHLTEGGVWGGVSMCLFTVAWYQWFKTPQLNTHPLALSLGMGLTGVVMHQGFDFGMESLGVALPSAAAWGLMWSYKPIRYTHLKPKQRKRHHSGQSRESQRRIWYSVQLGVSALMLFGLVSMLYVQAPLNLRSSVRRLDQNITTKREATAAIIVHPLSAYHALRMVNHASSLREREAWISHARHLAPRWSSPQLLEARSFAQRGFDELAALLYVRVLMADSGQRDLIYGDLRAHPLKQSITEWLPRKYWLSYYKFILSHDQKNAFQFLQNLSAHHLSAHSDLRAVWFRRVAYRCPLKRLADLEIHLSRSRDGAGTGRGQSQLSAVRYSREHDTLQSVVRCIDLSLIAELRDLCSQPVGNMSRSELRKMQSRLDLQFITLADTAKTTASDLFDLDSSHELYASQRETLGRSILKKAFENRVMLDSSEVSQ